MERLNVYKEFLKNGYWTFLIKKRENPNPCHDFMFNKYAKYVLCIIC